MDARDRTNAAATGTAVGYLHSYDCSRRWRDFNACGQAAVATLLDFHGCNPFQLEKTVYDPRDNGYHWEDAVIIDRIKSEFPPDYFAGLFGTTPHRLVEALQSAGLRATASWSREREEGLRIWREVKAWLSAGFPVITIVDRGKLGGRPVTAHWAVVHGVDGSGVHLANTKRVTTVPENRFLSAFACRFMPPPFNHCAIFCSPAESGEAATGSPGKSPIERWHDR